MTKTFKVSLGGPLLDQVDAMAANDGVEAVELIRRILWLWFLAGTERLVLTGKEALPADLVLFMAEALRSYKQSLDAYVRIRKLLLESPVVDGSGPLVVTVLTDLEIFGDAVSHVPGLVEQVEDGWRVVTQLRRQTAKLGILVPYDPESDAPEVLKDP